MADTQGQPSPQDGQGNDGPKYVTAEELNKAITARFTDHQKKLEKHLESFSGALTGKLEELLKAAVPAPAPTSTAETPKPADADSPALRGMMKQLEELKRDNLKIQQERDAERTRAKDATLRQQLSDALIKNGVDATRVKHAVGILVDSEKRVRFEEDGDSIVFKDNDNTDVDLLTGIKSWVKSDDGKFYLPPRGVNGSGDRGAGRAPNVTNTSKTVNAESLGNLILDEFGMKA